VLHWQEMQLTSSRLAWASDLRKPCLTR
jgi:hypothetical protein